MRSGHTITAIMLTALLSGCSTEYSAVTKQEELILIHSEREAKIGRSLSRQVEKRFKVTKDERLRERVYAIGQKLASVCDRKDVAWHFEVLSEDEFNAFALPGGYIYLFEGLLNKVESDDEIAAVVGHEMGHVAAKHAIKRIQSSIGYSALAVLVATGTRDSQAVAVANYGLGQLMLAYSRSDEMLADKLAIKYMRKACYDPKVIIKFLEKMRDIKQKAPIRPYTSARTHPYIADRIRAVRQEIEGKLTFDDYMNKGEELP